MLLKTLSRGIVFASLAVAMSAVLSASQLCVKVLDESNLPLPGAAVRAVRLADGQSQVRKTEENGAGCFVSIPEGLYSVEASLQGFLTVKYYPLRISYPQKGTLIMRLPLGEITEGRLAQDIVLSGTFHEEDRPTEGMKICLLEMNGKQVACTTTNSLGEYALLAPPGTYQVELISRTGAVEKYKVDLSLPGSIYHDILAWDKQP